MFFSVQVKQWLQNRRKTATKRGIPARELFPPLSLPERAVGSKSAFSPEQREVLEIGWKNGIVVRGCSAADLEMVVQLTGLNVKQVSQVGAHFITTAYSLKTLCMGFCSQLLAATSTPEHTGVL